MDQYLELRLSHKKRAPTYVYLFTHKAAASFTEIFKGGRENYWGKFLAEVSHLNFENCLFYFISLKVLVMPKSYNIYSQLPRACSLVHFQPKKMKKFERESHSYGLILHALGTDTFIKYSISIII